MDAAQVGGEGARLGRTGGNNAGNAVAVGDHKAIARRRNGIHNAHAQAGQRRELSFGVAAGVDRSLPVRTIAPSSCRHARARICMARRKPGKLPSSRPDSSSRTANPFPPFPSPATRPPERVPPSSPARASPCDFRSRPTRRPFRLLPLPACHRDRIPRSSRCWFQVCAPLAEATSQTST